MSDKTDDFSDLIRRVGEGSEEAAWELVEQYGETIRRAVRRRLNGALRPKFDSLDFVQLVWSSFFRVRSKVTRFGHPRELVAFLVTMARNKVGMEARRRLLTKKYNVNREHSLDQVCGRSRADVPDSQPAPIEVLIARETWNRMLEKRPEHYQQIIRMRLQGRTYQDIADSLQLAESTVRRFLKKLLRETVA